MLVVTATGVAAQDRSSLLASNEVERLVSNARPADHAQLRDHFAALTGVYLTDARRQKAMAQATLAGPDRQSGVTVAAHSVRLAELATASAETVRDLSAHHGRLANGRLSPAPSNNARRRAGGTAPALTDAQLLELAASIRPADHRRLEEYFTALADKYTSAANDYAGIARIYRTLHGRTATGNGAIHCDRMVNLSREAADEALAEAAEHRELAKAR